MQFVCPKRSRLFLGRCLVVVVLLAMSSCGDAPIAERLFKSAGEFFPALSKDGARTVLEDTKVWTNVTDRMVTEFHASEPTIRERFAVAAERLNGQVDEFKAKDLGCAVVRFRIDNARWPNTSDYQTLAVTHIMGMIVNIPKTPPQRYKDVVTNFCRTTS